MTSTSAGESDRGNAERPPAPETLAGLRYARWAGIVVGLVLVGYGPYTVFQAATAAGPAHFLRAAAYVLFGAWILYPWHRARSSRVFGWGFGILCGLAVIFVFLMIVSVIFDYMAAAQRDERLGVPGFEGTLIFFSLMQIPVQLFLRRPDLME